MKRAVSSLLLAATCIAMTLSPLHAQLEDIRLVDGPFNDSHIGRVEVMYNGTWGTICDDSWSQDDAAVACRMLGFRFHLCWPPGATFGEGTGPIWMDNVVCTGSEENLEQCRFNGWGVHSCDHSEDAGLVCASAHVVDAPSQVRVTNSTNTTITIEWMAPPIPRGITKVQYRVRYESDILFPRSFVIRASANDSNFSRTIRRLVPGTEYDVQVRAEVQYPYCTRYLFGNYSEAIKASTLNGTGLRLEDVRLVNGTFGPHMGRVEVLYDGQWGTICDDFWSYADADIACEMMGFRAAVCAITQAPFGEGMGPIWMDNLQCSGRETRLDECAFNGWGVHSCDHSKDAGAICATDIFSPPTTPQLIGSSTTSLSLEWEAPPSLPAGVTGLQFRVNYEALETPFRRQKFMRVDLADNKTTYNTTITGLSRSTEYAVQVRAEVQYQFCNRYLFSNYSEALTVSTNKTIRSSSIQVRLVPPDPSIPFMGRLEVFYNDTWGTVCDDFFSSDDARVACGMLNYTDALCSVPNAQFGEGEDPIWMDDVRCSRGEEVLDECPFRGWGVHNCQHDDDVGVVCVPDTDKIPGTVAEFSVVSVGATTVTLKWKPLAFVTAGNYRIKYSKPGDFFPRTILVPPTSSQYTVEQLQFGTNYTFTVRAEMTLSFCSSSLNGDYVDPIDVTTEISKPTGPPTEFHVVVLNATAILVEWDLPIPDLRNGIIRGYKVFVQPPGGDEMTFRIRGNDTNVYVVTGLQPKTAYIVSVLAYTVGDGPRSIRLTVITPSRDFVPVIVLFGIFGNGIDRTTRSTTQTGIQIFCGSGLSDVTLDWFFSNGTKVGTENRYLREGHFPNGTAVLDISSGRKLSVCDADIYTCVANSSSRGIQSKKFTLTINTLPPAPSSPSLIKAGSTWLSIAWDDPQCDGGHRVIAFDIEYSKDTSEIIRIHNSATRSYTIQNLEPNTQYSVRVRAVSADFRASRYSLSNLMNTLPAAPSEPRDVAVRLVTPLTVEVSWREPALPNGQIFRYTVYAIIAESTSDRRRRQAVIDPPGGIKETFPGSSTQGNITVPKDSVTYQFQVSASIYSGGQENQGSLSAITPESTIHVPKPGLPQPLDVRVVQINNASVTLQWSYPPPPIEPIINFMITYAGPVASLDEEFGERTSTSTRITVSPLTPDTTYQFRVSAITQQGQGGEVTVYATTAAPEGAKLAFFHIRIGPIQDCLAWHDNDDIAANIRSSLVSTLSSQCKCSLTTAHITNDELSCRGRLTNQIVYRARILGTSSYSASALVELMQSWVDEGQTSVNVGVSRLQVDPTCPVSLANLLAPDCPVLPTGTIPTTGSSDDSLSPGQIGGIVVGALIAVLLLVAIVLLAWLIWTRSKWSTSTSSQPLKEEDNTPFADIGETERYVHHDVGVFDADSVLKEKPTTNL